MQPMFRRQLDAYGPDATQSHADISLEEAQRYCRNLAKTHYENFTVASWLLPRRLRQPFCNVYAYCRWSDDLADEIQDSEESLRHLDWWENELEACFQGKARHPVFIALGRTIEEYAMESEPFHDLLTAFRRDQRRQCYETFDELLDYCRCSANPVGRIILALGRCRDPVNQQLSDSICTGLQLANFWQDVCRDHARGRVYLPRQSRQRFGYQDEMLTRRQFNKPFREMMAFEVSRAEGFFVAGGPLPSRMPKELRIDIELFVRGGLSVLQAIRQIDYDVWSKRPTISRLGKLRLLAGAAWTHVRPGRNKDSVDG